ncbi:RNA polymerase sigma factor [Candidatus Sumerlaeota bacterium]|nr:RNA polymerase sigma factor [Candidatus Sumerlaeota bacterium]
MTPDRDSSTDTALVQRAQGGDAAAFEQLIHRHAGLVHSLAWAHLRDRESAEDLAQEVFLRVHLNLHRLTEPSGFARWLSRLTRNLAIDWLRRGTRRSRLVTLVPLDETAGRVPDTDAKGARETMQAHERSDALQRAIDRLPSEQREVVLLHFGEEMKQREIAERLGMNPMRVSRLLRRALAALQREVVPALREASPALRTPSTVAVRSASLIAAVGAMSATARESLAAMAASAPASVVSMSPVGSVGPLSIIAARLAAGGILMNLSKGAAVVAVVVLGAVGYHHVTSQGQETGSTPVSVEGVDPSAAVPQREPVTLHMDYPLGAEWDFRTEMEMEMIIPIPTQGEMRQEMAMEFVGHERVLDVGRDGSAIVEVTTTSERMVRMTFNGQPYDTGTLGEMGSEPSTMQYDVDSRGGVGLLVFGLVDLPSADQFFQTLSMRLLSGLPDRPVRPGESWSREIVVPGTEDERATCTSTLERIEEIGGRRVAVIRREAELAVETPIQVSIPEAPWDTWMLSIHGPVTAEDHLFVDSGLPLRSTVEMDLIIPTGMRVPMASQDSVSEVRQRTVVRTECEHRP